MRVHRSTTAEISDTAMGGLLDKSLNENVGRRNRFFAFDTILM